MADNVIRTISFRGTSEGLDKLTADLKGLAAAEQNVAVVSDDLTKRQTSLQAAWKNTGLRLDEAARAQDNYARLSRQSAQALQQQVITADQHADRLKLLGERYGQVSQSSAKLISGMTAAGDVGAVASQKMISGMSAMGKEAATTVTHIDRVTTSSAALTKQSSRNAAEMLNLSRQFADVGVSLQAGQSPFTVLVQQGAQIVDVFASSNRTVGQMFSQAIGWAGRFVASTAGVVTGIAAIGAGALYAAANWADAQRDIERALIGIGKNSGLTAKDINELASSGATTFGLSVGQAREAALEFVKTGVIFRDNIKAAVAVTHDFAIVTGTDAKEAAKTLAAALADPVRGADALNKQLGFLDGKTREYIITLVNQNQLQEAQAVLLRNLAPTIQAATDTLGPFEKAWAAVANQVERFKNAVGKEVLSTPTDQEKLQQLIERRDQPRTGSGLMNQPGNAREIQRINEEIERLLENMRETARATAFTETAFKQLSIAADDVVRSVIPQVQQIQALEQALGRLKAAQEDSRISGRQGLGGENQAAINAIEVQLLKLKESKEEAERYNERVLAISQSWGNVGVSTALVLNKLQDQLSIAQAITGQQQIEAQYYATINSLLDRGKSLTEAIAVAEMQRAISLAQVNAQADRQLKNLQNEYELIVATSEEEKGRIRARQEYNKLVDEGVDSSRAGAIASQMQANARATEDAADNTKSWSVQQDEANDAINRTTVSLEEARRITQQIAEEAARAAAAYEAMMQSLRFVPTMLGDRTPGKNVWQAGGEWTQFNPAGYQSTGSLEMATIGKSIQATGEYLANIEQHRMENFTNQFNAAFATSGGNIGAAVSSMLGTQGLFTGGSSDTQKVSALSSAIDLLPKDQQISAYQSMFGQLQASPLTLETAPLLKQLGDKIADLTKATDENTGATSAMTDVLSPFYSSDPRSTHLGFRAFAGGGIMSQYGALPLRHYQSGGMATSPQVAVYGEGSVPEAYVPVPSGKIPVEIKGAANSNQRPIQVTINVQGSADAGTVAALRQTSFQKAQELRRMTAG